MYVCPVSSKKTFCKPLPALLSPLALPALSHSSPLSLPDLPIVDPPWTVSSPVQSWSVYPLALPRTSRPITPPRPVKQSAPPWLLAFSPLPGTVVSTTPPGFHVLPASPWSACAMAFWAFSYVSSLHLHLSPPASWLHLDCLSLWLRSCPPGTLMSPGPISSSAPPWSPAPLALSQSVVPLVPPARAPTSLGLRPGGTPARDFALVPPNFISTMAAHTIIFALVPCLWWWWWGGFKYHCCD